MRISLANTALIVAITVILVDTFYGDHLGQLGNPMLLAALGLVLYALFQKRKK